MNWKKEEIEARMMDALDGNLSKEDLQQLRLYLEEFPEFGSLDEEYPSLNNDDFVPFQKETLRKEVPFHPTAYSNEEGPEMEKMAIAKFEGLLTEKEESDFDQALKVEPKLQKEWYLVNQTKMQQNTSVYFPNSKSLHKEVRIVSWRKYLTYAAAASVLVCLFLAWPNPTSKVQASNKTVVKKSPSEQLEKQKANAPTPAITADKEKLPPRIIEHVEPVVMEGRECVIQEDYPEASNEIAMSVPAQSHPIPTVEQHALNGIGTTKGSEKTVSQDVMGLKEFVLQKGNERIFGTPNPSASERYTTVANYLSKATNLPINYSQSSNEKEEVTYVRLGFISIERKRTKK